MMTEKQLANYAEILLRGQISQLPSDMQTRVWECYDKLKKLKVEYGEAEEFASGIISTEDLQR